MRKKIFTRLSAPRAVWRAVVVVTIVAWAYFQLMGLLFPAVNPWRPMVNADPWTTDCRKTERDAAVSLDGSWRAATIDVSCVDAGVIRSWTTVVIVRPGQQPAEGDDFLSLSNVFGVAESKMSLDWSDDKRLIVTIPKGADVFDYTPQSGHIFVDLKIDG